MSDKKKDTELLCKDDTPLHGPGGVAKHGTVTFADGSKRPYQVLLAFKCMFCSRVVKVVVFTDDGAQAALHDDPQCEKFKSLSVEDFIKQTKLMMAADNDRRAREAN